MDTRIDDYVNAVFEETEEIMDVFGFETDEEIINRYTEIES